jgi:hypothetical protein
VYRWEELKIRSQDREQWRTILEEAKVHQGTKCKKKKEEKEKKEKEKKKEEDKDEKEEGKEE